MIILEPGAISVLHECCSKKTPAIILDPESDLFWHARFESLSEESFTLCLLQKTNNSLKAPRFFITFAHRGFCCAFFAKVLEYRSDPSLSSSSLILQLPSKITNTERRMFKRIPIGKMVVPLVRVSIEENRILHPKPTNLSLTGIMVEFDAAEDPDLLPPAEFELELRLGDHAVRLKSVIKHRDGRRYSLLFPEVVTKDGIDAPQPLRKIVDILSAYDSKK